MHHLLTEKKHADLHWPHPTLYRKRIDKFIMYMWRTVETALLVIPAWICPQIVFQSHRLISDCSTDLRVGILKQKSDIYKTGLHGKSLPKSRQLQCKHMS